MGESLGRIKVWVQEHPWLAALILGAVILVGYLVYRSRIGAGGGATTDGGQPGEQPIADQGGAPGTVPQPIPLPVPQPVQAGGGGGGGGHHGGGGGGISIGGVPIGNLNGGSGGSFTFPPDQTGLNNYGLPAQIPNQPVSLDGYSSGPGGKSKARYPVRLPTIAHIGFQTPQTSNYTPPKQGKAQPYVPSANPSAAILAQPGYWYGGLYYTYSGPGVPVLPAAPSGGVGSPVRRS